MNLIGISARMGGGKDLTGSIIQYLTSGSTEAFETWNLCHLKSDKRWQIVKFANKLKECAAIILNIPRSSCEDYNVKNTVLGKEWDYAYFQDTVLSIDDAHRECNNEMVRWDDKYEQHYTIRQILQQLGTEVGRAIHPNFWVNALFSDYKKTTLKWDADGNSTVETYPNWIISDMRFPNEMRAIEDRGGITIRLLRNSGVPSDHCSETALDNAKFDYTIDNRTTTIDQLIKMVKDILIIEKIITKD